MRRRSMTTLTLALVLAAAVVSGARGNEGARFPEAMVRFEQNATDGDVEVVFEVGGTHEGLAKLVVRSPDGRIVVDFTAPDKSTLGIRSFRFESPEPRDSAGLKAAYPAGAYEFTGETVSGAKFHGSSTLTHELPPTVTFESPAEDAEDVATEDLDVAWSGVNGLVAVIVEIQDEEGGSGIEARLPGSATHFAVPAGLLLPGVEYQLSIGTESAAGNVSFVETSFTTAEEK